MKYFIVILLAFLFVSCTTTQTKVSPVKHLIDRSNNNK